MQTTPLSLYTQATEDQHTQFIYSVPMAAIQIVAQGQGLQVSGEPSITADYPGIPGEKPCMNQDFYQDLGPCCSQDYIAITGNKSLVLQEEFQCCKTLYSLSAEHE